jgi:hypothetical protein
MKFESALHTKQFLIANPEIAFALAKSSEEFSLTCLSQDVDILSLKKAGDGCALAHELAWSSYQWSKSEAAQSLEVLSILSDKGESVAHRLAFFKPDWAATEAAQRFDVLSITDKDGESVAHELAFIQPEWHKTKAAQDFSILSIKSKNGRSVGHRLALHQENWCNTDGAMMKDVLGITCTEEGSVAQVILCFCKDKGLFLSKILKSGFSYKSEPLSSAANRPILYEDDVQKFTELSLAMIADEALEVAKVKLLLIFFSTSKNILDDVKDAGGKTFLLYTLDSVAAQIRQIYKGKPNLFEDIIKPEDENCEPAKELMHQLISERNLSNIESMDSSFSVVETPSYLVNY